MGLDREREILTVSTKLAFTALKKENEQMFEASNIGRFLEILTDITRNKGAELKMKTPGDRMNATILEILGQLQKAQDGVKEYKDSLVEKQKQMTERGALLTEEMQSKCVNRISHLIREKSNEIENQKSVISAAELEALLNEEVYKTLAHACIGEFAKSGEILSKYTQELKVGSVGELKMKTDTIEYTVRKVNTVPRQPKGLFEHLGALFLDKTYYKTEVGTGKETQTVALGVNEQQIMATARQKVAALFDDVVPSMMEKISKHIVEPMIQLLENGEDSIRGTMTELEQLKC